MQPWATPTPPPSPFNEEELTRALDRMKNQKAPGPDGIPAKAIKMAGEECKGSFLELLSGLLCTQDFPRVWKDAKWRSEKLTKAIQENGDLSANQYGFRKNKSTVLAISKIVDGVMGAPEITVDVRNALNTANRDKIINNLNGWDVLEYLVRLIRAYFYEKRLIITKDVSQQIFMGVPQGSVFGPLLWNVLYDDVLEIPRPSGTGLVEYANDLSIVIKADDEKDLMHRGNLILRRLITTADTAALQVITGPLPIELLVRERTLIYETPEQERPQVKKMVRNTILQE
ncbi:hypothetical protein JTB14_018422 [Gonioctena quinquepunctata]|nr:hypothetical protein JTB14_018422 [Gonioctena quinquepunctata]